MGGVTANVEYTIAKADPQASDFTFTAPSGLTYDGSKKEATVTAKTGITGMGAVTVKYFKKYSENYYEELKNATAVKDAGTYLVKINVAAGDNYKAASDPTDPSWKFTIQKADYTGESIEIEQTVLVTGAGQEVTVDMTGYLPKVNGDVLDGAKVSSVSVDTDSDDIIDADSLKHNGNEVTFSLNEEGDVTNQTTTIKVTITSTNYKDITAIITVKTKDKDQATVEISGLPETVTYGQEFTLTPTAKDGGTTLTGGTWTWDYDTAYFQLVESNANTGVLKLQAIKAGTPSKNITMTYTSDTHTDSHSVAASSIAKKTLTQADLSRIPSGFSKDYDGTPVYTMDWSLTLKASVCVTENGKNLKIAIPKEQIILAQSDVGRTTGTITLPTLPDDWNYTFVDGFTKIEGIVAEIKPRKIRITSATAENRVFKFENKAVDVSNVTFGNLPDSVTLIKDTDYTVTGVMNDPDAGMNKTVTVEVTMLNGNYSLTTNTTTTKVDISKATYGKSSVAINWRYNEAGEKTVSLNGNLPSGVGTAHYSIQGYTDNGVLTGTPTMVERTSTVTYTLAGQKQYTANQTVQFSVKVESPNYEPFTILCVITLVDKGDASVNITGMPDALTYGDTFTLTAAARDDDAGTSLTDGAWTWASTDFTVLAIEENGNSATVKALKAGAATISVSYESDTMKGTTTASVTVGKKPIAAPRSGHHRVYLQRRSPDLSADEEQ